MDEPLFYSEGLLSVSNQPDELNRFNEWMFGIIEPFRKGRLLELGSGLNTISGIFVQKSKRIHLSSPEKAIREQLRSAYQGIEIVRNVHSINFHRTNFAEAYPVEESRMFDTVLLLNASDNGIFNEGAVFNAIHLLKERGRLIFLAPVYTALYDELDLNQEDLQRLNWSSIQRLLTDEMEIIMTRFFNLKDAVVYDRSGLSVVVVARKK